MLSVDGPAQGTAGSVTVRAGGGLWPCRPDRLGRISRQVLSKWEARGPRLGSRVGPGRLVGGWDVCTVDAGASDSHEPPVRPAVLKVAPTLISAPGLREQREFSQWRQLGECLLCDRPAQCHIWTQMSLALLQW